MTTSTRADIGARLTRTFGENACGERKTEEEEKEEEEVEEEEEEVEKEEEEEETDVQCKSSVCSQRSPCV